MRTAVQLRTGQRMRCNLVYGPPAAIEDGTLGPIALFAPGVIVAYRIELGRRVRTFVFRTLAVADPLAAVVPGVAPSVQLLVDVHSRARNARLERLFRHIVEDGWPPSELPNTFYCRVSHALAGRPPSGRALRALLRHGRGAPHEWCGLVVRDYR